MGVGNLPHITKCICPCVKLDTRTYSEFTLCSLPCMQRIRERLYYFCEKNLNATHSYKIECARKRNSYS